ncbi:MAG: restriction endonuclease subunit S, partial [Verrucomicrobia bacterium]
RGQFDQAWQRIHSHFDTLFTTESSIDQLKQTILQLAVMGKLVEQDPRDEPAEKLFAELKAEQKRFVETYKFRAPPAKAVDDSSTPCELPRTWKWCRMSSLFNAITDGDHLPPPKSYDGVAFLTIGNITTGKLDFEGCRFVPVEYYNSLADFRRPICGDILYTVVGATYGRAAFVGTDQPFCVQRHIAILKPPSCIDVGYLMVLLRAPLTYQQATASTTGTAQPTIPLGNLRNFLAPLPPLAEQRRIVAKVEELMTLCDRLKATLQTAQTTQLHLADTFTNEALCDKIGTDGLKSMPQAINLQ